MTKYSVKFDGHALDDYFSISELVRGKPPAKVETVAVPGRNGLVVTGRTFDAMTVSMTLTAWGYDRQRMRDAFTELWRWLDVDEPRRLEFGDDSGRYYLAIPSDGGDVAEWINAGSASVQFLIPDPIMYGTKRSVTIPSGGVANIYVGGTYPTLLAISAAAAVRSGTLWGIRLDDGKYSNVTIPTANATAVIIDAETREVLVGGVPSMITLSSDWLELEPGEHKLEMTQGTGAATATWVERWL